MVPQYLKEQPLNKVEPLGIARCVWVEGGRMNKQIKALHQELNLGMFFSKAISRLFLGLNLQFES